MFSPSQILVIAPLLAVALTAAITDTRTGLIPNWLTLPILLAAPLAHFTLGGSEALQDSLIGLAVCALVPAVFFARGALGGGDLKLFAALGAIGGAHAGLTIQFLAFAIATGFALVLLAHRGALRAMLARAFGVLTGVVGHVRATPVDRAAMTSLRLGAPVFLAALAFCALEVAR